MAQTPSIPIIDIAPLFGPSCPARDAVDRSVMAAAALSGFTTITGLPEEIRPDATIRRRLLRLFAAPRKLLAGLSWNRSDPSHPLVYRGWFGPTEGRAYYYEGMELGPDVAHGGCVPDAVDPLRSPTPMPSEADLPGWRAAVRDYFLGMESAADALLRAITRGLSLPEERLSGLFVGGMSSLWLLRYPVRTPSVRAGVAEDQLYVTHDGVRREVISEAHYDKRRCSVNDLRAFAPGDKQLVLDIEGVRCGFLICLDWAFPELWQAYAGEVELVFHSCVSDDIQRDRNPAHVIPSLMQGYAWLGQYAISVSNSCRPSQDFPSVWIERSGHRDGRAPSDKMGHVINALADDPEQDRFFEMVRRFRRSASDGSLYAPHLRGSGPIAGSGGLRTKA